MDIKYVKIYCKKKFGYRDSERKMPLVDDDTIVVYSDTIYGNPLAAKNVVRWFLYYNRYENCKKVYGNNIFLYATENSLKIFI